MSEGWKPLSDDGGRAPSGPMRSPSAPSGPQRPDRTALYVVGSVVAVILLCCGGFGGLGAYIASTAPTVLPEDRAGVVNIVDVQGWVDDAGAPDTQWEQLDIGPSVLGTREWDYEYEPPDDAEQVAFVSSSRSDELSQSEARSTFSTLKFGAGVGVRMIAEGVELEDTSELLSWGDEAYFARMVGEVGPIGQVVVVRRGRTVLFAVFGPVWFSDAEAVDEFLVPVLDRAADYHLPERPKVE